MLAAEELVTKTKIMESLKHVDSNHSFVGANNDSNRFRLMLPDYEIARSYRQGEFKVRYSIQYDVTPYFKEQLLEDFRNFPLSFQFDESTTSQI